MRAITAPSASPATLHRRRRFRHDARVLDGVSRGWRRRRGDGFSSGSHPDERAAQTYRLECSRERQRLTILRDARLTALLRMRFPLGRTDQCPIPKTTPFPSRPDLSSSAAAGAVRSGAQDHGRMRPRPTSRSSPSPRARTATPRETFFMVGREPFELLPPRDPARSTSSSACATRPTTSPSAHASRQAQARHHKNPLDEIPGIGPPATRPPATFRHGQGDPARQARRPDEDASVNAATTKAVRPFSRALSPSHG